MVVVLVPESSFTKVVLVPESLFPKLVAKVSEPVLQGVGEANLCPKRPPKVPESSSAYVALVPESSFTKVALLPESLSTKLVTKVSERVLQGVGEANLGPEGPAKVPKSSSA